MRPIGVISTTALFLLLGLAVPAQARQEKQQENAKPQKQEQQAKPEKQQLAKPQQQQQQKSQQQAQQQQRQQQSNTAQQQQQQAKPQQQQANSAKQQQQQQHSQQQAQQQQRQQQTASSHGGPQRTQQAMTAQRSQPQLRLSDRGSGRIPDDRFRSHFGREHHFHMGNPVMVGGYSRFQYGGYWFGFVDPWPVDWYYTDDYYIDYVDGGYYMYNPYYPGARFAITVVI